MHLATGGCCLQADLVLFAVQLGQGIPPGVAYMWPNVLAVFVSQNCFQHPHTDILAFHSSRIFPALSLNTDSVIPFIYTRWRQSA
jgi:hypothetical protein